MASRKIIEVNTYISPYRLVRELLATDPSDSKKLFEAVHELDKSISRDKRAIRGMKIKINALMKHSR